MHQRLWEERQGRTVQSLNSFLECWRRLKACGCILRVLGGALSQSWNWNVEASAEEDSFFCLFPPKIPWVFVVLPLILVNSNWCHTSWDCESRRAETKPSSKMSIITNISCPHKFLSQYWNWNTEYWNLLECRKFKPQRTTETPRKAEFWVAWIKLNLNSFLNFKT